MSENSMIIGRQSYKYREIDMHVSDLQFYPENPRVYSLLVVDDEIPEQQEIEEKLTGMEHVRKLKQSIESNGGLIDPLIVRDGDFVVLEGNSRLAAYRMLATRDSIKWGKVKCRLLPSDISDSTVFTLLGQYHIVGRQDWSPFEQAGYLWRRVNKNNILPETLAKEMGISVARTKKVIEVYEFMRQHKDVDSNKWSYYEEYLKPRSISKARSEHPNLDATIAKKIKTGEIPQAIDIRQKLEPITRINKPQKRKRLLKDFIEGRKGLEECFEEAQAWCANTDVSSRLSKIRSKLVALNNPQIFSSMQEGEKNKCMFEVKKIISSSQYIKSKLD